jgi:hypothetical protein
MTEGVVEMTEGQAFGIPATMKIQHVVPTVISNASERSPSTKIHVITKR